MSTTTLAAPIRVNTTGVHARPGLGRLVAVELRKMVNTRAELLAATGTIVEAADLAALDAALHHAGLTTHPADGGRRLVEAEPKVIARLAMANDVVLRRLAPAEHAGLERLFFELTGAGGSAPSPKTDSIHPELAGVTA